MADFDVNPLKLREIILNTKKPIVFKNFPLNWSCFQDGLKDWCKKFDELNCCSTNFERMSKIDCLEPQWERKRKVIEMTAMQFLEEHSKDCDYWSGLNYKRRLELPDKCTDGIDFSPFGFQQAADDCTLWLSSSGANTPCHYDSYGCNIVVQVFGKKSWHLLPPNTPLTTTRVPYEESSIYCKENFYSPSEMKEHLESFKDLIYHVILEPNDVLIVPKHWWHYVEAVNISLSVNTWIPLKCDLEQQIEECIVKYLIENIVRNSPLMNKTYMMNPNQLTAFATNDELLNILKYLLEQSKNKDSNAKRETSIYDYHYLSESKVEELLNDSKTLAITISPMTNVEMQSFFKSRYSGDAKSSTGENTLGLLEEILINSICSPFLIKTIKNEFVKRYTEKLEIST